LTLSNRFQEDSLAKLLLAKVQLLEFGIRRGQWAKKAPRGAEGKITSMLG